MPFTLTAKPTILREEFPGSLEYITFQAIGEGKDVSTFFENDGVHLLSRLMPHQEAIQVLAELEAGRDVEFTGTYTREELIAFGLQGLSVSV